MNLNSLIVYVVNFETEPTALVGPMITKATESIIATNRQPHLGFMTVPPSAFDNDPLGVRRAVYNWEAWAAIVINSNATTLLQQAVQQGNASFDPLGTCQIIYQSARDETTYYNYILPQLTMLQSQVTSMFGKQWTTEVLSNTSIPRTTLQLAPQALNPAIGFSMFDLRPFYPPVATPAVTIGLIYLIIIAFFSFTFYLPIHMKFITPGQGHPTLKFWQLILWRWISTLVAYLVMSLAYSLISLAFQIPFSHDHAPETIVAEGANAFGRATFVVYWMVNFIGMAALGLACENVAMVIGQPWTAMWLIFWVITNVSTSFYAEELSPKFYNWGVCISPYFPSTGPLSFFLPLPSSFFPSSPHLFAAPPPLSSPPTPPSLFPHRCCPTDASSQYAWPLHSVVEASRTLIFDLKNQLGLDFGILLAWVGINSALFPLCCYCMQWKTQKAKKKEQEEKEG